MISVPPSNRARLPKEQRARSTYTPGSAFKWLPTLQDIVAEVERDGSAFLSSSSFQRSPTTLNIVLHDALLWLQDHGDEPYSTFARNFKNLFSLRKEHNGVRVLQKLTKPVAKVQSVEEEPEDLRKEILRWYASAEDGDIREWDHIAIDDGLKSFVLNLVAQNVTGEAAFKGSKLIIQK